MNFTKPHKTEISFFSGVTSFLIFLGWFKVGSRLVRGWLKLFSDERNILIADAILKLHIDNKPIDLLTLVEKLRKEQNFEASGGLLYISELTSSVSSTANLEYHLRMLQQYWLTRYINECCSEAQFDLIEYKKDIFDVYAELQLKLDLATKDIVQKDLVALGTIHSETMKSAYESIGKGSSGVPSGIDRLDNLTNGFQKSDLIILAGRTSMGKTAFSISILIEPVVFKKIPVAFFSLEMSKEQVVGRVQSFLLHFHEPFFWLSFLTPSN